MRDTKILTAMSAVALLAGAASAGTSFKVADSFEDFQGAQGENGWFYGYYDSTAQDPFTPDTFELMTDWDPVNNRWWADNASSSNLTLIDADFMHPTFRGDGFGNLTHQWSVRRWVSNINGPVMIQMDLSLFNALGQPQADGVRLHVFVDGERRLVSTLNPANPTSLELELFESIAEGSVIDFAIDPIGNSSYDAVEFSAVIMSTVPSPASLALLGFGALALSGRRR